jgi:hypothetical protein
MGEQLLQDAFFLLEGDVNCWNDAAQGYENIAATLTGREAAEYGLLAAVCRERAQLTSNALRTTRPLPK